MTYKEAIEVLKRWKGCKENRFDDFCKQKRTCIGCEYEFDDEEFKEAMQVALEALEKQIPKKPKPIYIYYGGEPVVVSYNCTACELEVGVNYADGHKKREHHCHCGQRINWSDEE